jgi:MbtH protein
MAIWKTEKETGLDAAEQTYKVVRNQEGQYSIWPASRDAPHGWQEEGKRGTKEECLAHIQVVWTDMRPASLRS